MVDQNQPRPAGAELKRLLAFLVPFLWPKNEPGLRTRVVLATVVMVAGKLLNIQVPFFLKRIVDALSLPNDLMITLPVAALLAYGAARLGAALFQELRGAIFARVGERAGRRVAIGVYRHLFDLSLRYHLERRSGELSRSVERGVKAISFLLTTALFAMAPVVVELILVLGILLKLYPWTWAFAVFVTIAVYATFTIWTTNWRTKYRREMNRLDNLFAGQATDGLINYEMVKAFTAEEHETRRLDQAMAQYENAAVKSQTSLSILNTGQAAIIAIGVTALMALSASRVVAGEATVGDVVLINAFILQLYLPLNFLGVLYRELKQSLTDLENLAGLSELRPEVADHPTARPLALNGGEVRFQDVSFAYDPRRPILDGLSFTIPPGKKLAIVGPSGAGKSTVVRLLFRFYDVTTGSVTIDGQDVRELQQRSLRQSIGVVPQDTVLFNDTIRINIAYARPDAPMEDIVAAARTAQIHDFIMKLPDGYDTVVGERGLKLSGGEKQRVAMARVMLKDPPILILDEATSALDSRTEQALQEALHRVAAGRTTLVIAHRLSTVVDSDEILVLEHGKVVERGDHGTLLALGGLYAQMWRRQHERPVAEPQLAK
ncbi:MAG TPA: ABC transporter ATP-binding protein/permease [Geminicoccus sp.]|jgi:ATP-binding cassette subfamily B protein|uniref:ABCB family ABC transporter ATP-binding protein/permease n=1 Tax=Geminicoccus sp. TaxID=2024832 RepID=UPI002E31FD43|nr:ABC transporter ATP-binding protein/permease [Geminicoccus sp.]HEX2528996.1 ABC transporter ATP-binding protein/permease [Geminicoccus sp.]